MMTAISAVHSWAARALFRLRKFVADGWRDHARNTEMLVAFGPTRPRSRSKALGRPIGTYDGTCLPARERQRTNWCHGSTEKSDHCFQSAVRRSPARRRRRWPKRAFCPLVTPFFSQAVPGNLRTGPCGPAGPPYGRTEHGRSRGVRHSNSRGGGGVNGSKILNHVPGSRSKNLERGPRNQ